MSESAATAVFLSYARVDAAAARRIAEALRSSGIEVWFDENELRGGDAWDQKIRRQINDCTLFVAIISRNTESRAKGYFRLEWKLAVEQTHMLLEGVPFVVPVVIDETPESAAAVPPEFLRVQWTRLPGSLPTPQFVEQVKRLLASMVTPGITPAPFSMRPTAAQGPVAAPAAKSKLPMAVAALLAVALAVAGWWWLRPIGSPAAPAAAGASPLPNDKSIAVLPFENRSADPNNAFFAEGIHDDLLTCLQKISALRVVSSQSVLRYRDSPKPVREIASELGVAWILTGSVARSGEQAHITGQLIDAHSDRQVQAFSDNRNVSDLFTVQAEIAQAIAASLQATLSPREKELIAQRPTSSQEAYDLYLRAITIKHTGSFSLAERLEMDRLLQRAVQLDSGFGLAWCEIAQNSAALARLKSRVPYLAQAKVAYEHAMRLVPDSPEGFNAHGWYEELVTHDYSRAAEVFEEYAHRWPNDSEPYKALGALRAYAKGSIDETTIGYFRDAIRLDPGYYLNQSNLATVLLISRRYQEASAEWHHIATNWPEKIEAAYWAAMVSWLAQGSSAEAKALVATLPADVASSPIGIRIRHSVATFDGDLAAISGADVSPGIDASVSNPWSTDDISPIAALLAAGRVAEGRALAGRILSRTKSQLVDNGDVKVKTLWLKLALIEAIAGDANAAQDALAKARNADDTAEGRGVADYTAAIVAAWSGKKQQAVDGIEHALSRPTGAFVINSSLPYPNVYLMRRDPRWFPLQGDPRFEALLNDPKNNAPLF